MNSKDFVILVDLDSIVADLTGAWFALYNQEFDDDLTMDRILTWDTHNYVKKQAKGKIYGYLTAELYAGLNILNGAKEALDFLADKYTVMFLTAAPRHTADAKINWVIDKFKWASKKDVMIGHRKELVKGNVFIDDSPHNIAAYRKAWPDALIMTIAYPYNREVSKFCDVRTGSWRGAESAWQVFVSRIEEEFAKLKDVK